MTTTATCFSSATAVELGEPLCTANARHFRVIGELEVKMFRVGETRG